MCLVNLLWKICLLCHIYQFVSGTIIMISSFVMLSLLIIFVIDNMIILLVSRLNPLQTTTQQCSYNSVLIPISISFYIPIHHQNVFYMFWQSRLHNGNSWILLIKLAKSKWLIIKYQILFNSAALGSNSVWDWLNFIFIDANWK